MTRLVVRGGGAVAGTCSLPGDKAISHRALILGALGHGSTMVQGLAPGQDVASTLRCLERLLVTGIHVSDREVKVDGRGVESWSRQAEALDCGNSGTTMRILSGALARAPFRTVLDGDPSLRRRPMERVAAPLRALGARVTTNDGRPPIEVHGGRLTGTQIGLDVASGQVKSAVLIAGLGASGRTSVIEPAPSRDDTERMLRALGAEVTWDVLPDGGARAEVASAEIGGFEIDVPGDLSSAAFLLTAGMLAGCVRLEDVALNPTRAGFLDVARRMGGDLHTGVDCERLGEPVGWVECRRADRSRPELQSVGLEGPVVPSLVDELPLVAVLASQARGETVVRGAAELRVKESDRIAALADGLGRLGADFTELPDGFVVRGPTVLRGAEVSSWGDHRIALALAVAGVVAEGETVVTGYDAAAVSWPGFEEALASLGVECRVVT